MNKIPVYFMPGLAASPLIFEKIKFMEGEIEVFLLEWILPFKQETLLEYAKRLSEKIEYHSPILIGVSFGGILVQEIAKIIPIRKIIIISSVKSRLEFPLRMKLAGKTKIYKLFPTQMVAHLEKLPKLLFDYKKTTRFHLYKKFLTIRDKDYLDWAIEQLLLWDRMVVDSHVIHIHGDKDAVFPIKNIKNCIVVEGGDHAMVLMKYKWLNDNLPKIIKG